MSDEDQVMGSDELTVLKDRAQLMGIKFSNNIGVEALRTKIQERLNGVEETPEVVNQVNALDPTPAKDSRRAYIDEQMKLVRCRITNNDPKKNDIQGEIYTLSNEVLGTVRRFVPWGEITDEGWHIPYCIYKMLLERKFHSIRTVRDRRTGGTTVQTQWVREFTLDVMEPLTEKELKELANRQAASQGLID